MNKCLVTKLDVEINNTSLHVFKYYANFITGKQYKSDGSFTTDGQGCCVEAVETAGKTELHLYTIGLSLYNVVFALLCWNADGTFKEMIRHEPANATDKTNGYITCELPVGTAKVAWNLASSNSGASEEDCGYVLV